MEQSSEDAANAKTFDRILASLFSTNLMHAEIDFFVLFSHFNNIVMTGDFRIGFLYIIIRIRFLNG